MTNDKKVVSHYNDPKKAQSGKPVDQSMYIQVTTTVLLYGESLENIHTKKIPRVWNVLYFIFVFNCCFLYIKPFFDVLWNILS